MMRNNGPLTKPGIPFRNALQTELVSVIEFSEMITSDNHTQLQTALERVRYGYRAVNSFKDTVIHVTLKAGEVFSIPTCGVYAVGLLKETYERVLVRNLPNQITNLGLDVSLKDKTLTFASKTMDCTFILFLEFELEVVW